MSDLGVWLALLFVAAGAFIGGLIVGVLAGRDAGEECEPVRSFGLIHGDRQP